MTSIALVGPDGVGKSTVAKLVIEALPSAAYAYLGTNPSVRPLLLPTTRLAARARGGVTTTAAQRELRTARRGRSSAVVAWVRACVWLTEELARGVEARRAERTAQVVIRDRDFLLDRFAVPGRPTTEERFHRWALLRFYPRPDLAVVLDAPAAVTVGRKADLGHAEAEARRRGYAELRGLVPAHVVDARGTVDEVATAVTTIVREHLDSRLP